MGMKDILQIMSGQASLHIYVPPQHSGQRQEVIKEGQAILPIEAIHSIEPHLISSTQLRQCAPPPSHMQSAESQRCLKVTAQCETTLTCVNSVNAMVNAEKR